MFEHHSSPGGFGSDWIHQRQQSAAAVHHGHFHRNFVNLADLNTRLFVLRKEPLVRGVESAALHNHTALDAPQTGLQDLFGVQGIHCVRRAGKFEILGACVGQHAAELARRLARIVDQAQKVEGTAAALPFRIGGHQFVQEPGSRFALLREFGFERVRSARKISRQSLIGRNRREKFGPILNHSRETFLDQTIQHFVDLLPRHVGASRQFQGLESRMPHQHQVRSCFVRVQAQSLEALPEAAKFEIGWLFARHGTGRA